MRLEVELLPKGHPNRQIKAVSAELDITVEALKRRVSKNHASMVLSKLDGTPFDDGATLEACCIKAGDRLR